MPTGAGPAACTWGVPGGQCGATDGVRRYQHGHRCPAHLHGARPPEQPPPGPPVPVVPLEQLDLLALPD
ncbi:hypothetical protein ACIRL2_29230 [Embleya sp. NPDC127516]|uniref:hypothetical protein n=1 Tax=Embleya sp. NPDC127516 TaxID=3363990 RepID=UPI00382A0756